jgi:hypothetical protein
MFICGQNGKKIYSYSLSTAFDISTASYDNISLNVNTGTVKDHSPTGIRFNNDGSKLFVLGDQYERIMEYATPGAWTYSSILMPSDYTAVRGAGTKYIEYGAYMSITPNGDRALISAHHAHTGATKAGRVYSWTRSGSTWTQEAVLIEPTQTANSYFGSAVSINAAGTECAIAAFGATVGSTTGVGAVYVFTRSGSTWTLQQKVVMSGTPIANTNFGGKTGRTVYGNVMELVGDYLYVGAQTDDTDGTDNGALYVFRRSGTTWTQNAKLYGDTGQAVGFDTGQKMFQVEADENYPNTVFACAEEADTSNAVGGRVYEFKKS